MKSKLIKLIITGLLITLSILSIFTYKSYNRSKQADLQQLNNKTQQEQTTRIISKETLIDVLNKENSINVLSGEVNTKVVYSNKNISVNDPSFKWLANKLSEMNSKDLTVDNSYKFLFSYDLNNIPITITNNTVNIRISPNRLSLIQCELSQTNSIKDRVGLLEGKFTPSQITSIQSRTRDLAYNRILSDEELRTQALESLQGDIKDLIKPLVSNSTNIHFELSDYDVIQDDTISIIK